MNPVCVLSRTLTIAKLLSLRKFLFEGRCTWFWTNKIANGIVDKYQTTKKQWTMFTNNPESSNASDAVCSC